MSKVDEMRKLKEDIIASYDARVTTVGEIVGNVHEIASGTREMLGRFYQERQETANDLKEMSNKLKEHLAQGESARLSVFGVLFDDIQSLLGNIVSLQVERKAEVVKTLSEAKSSRAESFGELMNEIQSKLNDIRARQKEREGEVSSLLETFDKEQQEIAHALNEAFEQAKAYRSKSEVARLEEAKAFLDDVQQKHNARKDEVKSLTDGVTSLLDSYAEEREGMAAAWRNLSEIIRQRKSGVPSEVAPIAEEEAPPAEEVALAVEEVPEEAAPVEEEAPPAEEAAPVVEKAPEEAAPVGEDREELQAKMLSLISSHPNGLKLVDLGEELGVPWRSLIPLARNLVESGQVTKVDVLYYPAPLPPHAGVEGGLDLQVVMEESEAKEAEESEEE